MFALLTGYSLILLGAAPAFAADFAGPHVEAVIGWNRTDGGAGGGSLGRIDIVSATSLARNDVGATYDARRLIGSGFV